MDYSQWGSSVFGILWARILEWVAISFSRGFSWPRDRTHASYISCIGWQVLYHWHHMWSPERHEQVVEKQNDMVFGKVHTHWMGQWSWCLGGSLREETWALNTDQTSALWPTLRTLGWAKSGRWWRTGSLVCCSPWGHKKLDTTEWLNNNNEKPFQGF